MNNIRFLSFAVLMMVVCCVAAKPKLVRVKLTGTILEDVEMQVGRSGRVEVISMLPYVFDVNKEDLPLMLNFKSERYEYTPITVPVRPTDDIGHVYLLKSESKQQQVNAVGSMSGAQEKTTRVKGIDVTYGVNAAPYTGYKSENTFALIIANEEYEMAVNVENATGDGLAFKEYCSKTFGLSEGQIKYVPNATVGKMKKAINGIKNIARTYNGDINLLVYYAGHGIPDNATKDAYLMPVDADGTDMEVCFSLKRFYSEIESMEVNQAVVFLDACFSGSQRDGDMIVAARGVAIKANDESPKGNTVIFSATSGEEAAYSYKDEKHGLFTYYLLKGLQESKGKISLGDLADYIKENVGKQSILINSKKQTPTVTSSDNIADLWRDMRMTGNKKR